MDMMNRRGKQRKGSSASRVFSQIYILHLVESVLSPTSPMPLKSTGGLKATGACEFEKMETMLTSTLDRAGGPASLRSEDARVERMHVHIDSCFSKTGNSSPLGLGRRRGHASSGAWARTHHHAACFTILASCGNRTGGEAPSVSRLLPSDPAEEQDGERRQSSCPLVGG